VAKINRYKVRCHNLGKDQTSYFYLFTRVNPFLPLLYYSIVEKGPQDKRNN